MKRRSAKLVALMAGCTSAMLSVAPAAVAHWGMPQEIPVDRVIKNLETWVKDHPSDHEAFYSLARARAYAFATTSEKISVYGGENPHYIVTFGPARPRVPSEPTKNLHTSLDHLNAGIQAFNSAIKLQPDHASYLYGLACLLEDGAGVRREAKAFPMLDVGIVKKETANWLGDGADLNDPSKLKLLRDKLFPEDRFGYRSGETAHAAEWVLVRARNKAGDTAPAGVIDLLADAWMMEMYDLYFRAACTALPDESKAVEQGLTGLNGFLACQSAQDYLRVSKDIKPGEKYPIRDAVAKSVVKSFESLPPCNAITPLIIPLSGTAASAHDLIDKNARVQFDLDGTGRPQTYVWPGGSAALLAWDPQHTGKITSGRQLFGSATWWLFFNDGFAALSSLDDNHDGFIRGDELSGLALWVDSNANGVSDPGEVAPIETFKITSLSCHASGHDGDSLISAGGVELADGTKRHLWDWVTKPLSVGTSRDQSK